MKEKWSGAPLAFSAELQKHNSGTLNPNTLCAFGHGIKTKPMPFLPCGTRIIQIHTQPLITLLGTLVSLLVKSSNRVAAVLRWSKAFGLTFTWDLLDLVTVFLAPDVGHRIAKSWQVIGRLEKDHFIRQIFNNDAGSKKVFFFLLFQKQESMDSTVQAGGGNLMLWAMATWCTFCAA